MVSIVGNEERVAELFLLADATIVAAALHLGGGRGVERGVRKKEGEGEAERREREGGRRRGRERERRKRRVLSVGRGKQGDRKTGSEGCNQKRTRSRYKTDALVVRQGLGYG